MLAFRGVKPWWIMVDVSWPWGWLAWPQAAIPVGALFSHVAHWIRLHDSGSNVFHDSGWWTPYNVDNRTIHESYASVENCKDPSAKIASPWVTLVVHRTLWESLSWYPCRLQTPGCSQQMSFECNLSAPSTQQMTAYANNKWYWDRMGLFWGIKQLLYALVLQKCVKTLFSPYVSGFSMFQYVSDNSAPSWIGIQTHSTGLAVVSQLTAHSGEC